MRNAHALAITSTAATQVAWQRYRRVEKSSESPALNGERQDASDDRSFASEKALRAKASHNETDSRGGGWSTLRLVPGFVTQLIAQVTETGAKDTASALAAYGNGKPSKIALLYDRDA